MRISWLVLPTCVLILSHASAFGSNFHLAVSKPYSTSPRESSSKTNTTALPRWLLPLTHDASGICRHTLSLKQADEVELTWKGKEEALSVTFLSTCLPSHAQRKSFQVKPGLAQCHLGRAIFLGFVDRKEEASSRVRHSRLLRESLESAYFDYLEIPYTSEGSEDSPPQSNPRLLYLKRHYGQSDLIQFEYECYDKHQSSGKNRFRGICTTPKPGVSDNAWVPPLTPSSAKVLHQALKAEDIYARRLASPLELSTLYWLTEQVPNRYKQPISLYNVRITVVAGQKYLSANIFVPFGARGSQILVYLVPKKTGKRLRLRARPDLGPTPLPCEDFHIPPTPLPLLHNEKYMLHAVFALVGQGRKTHEHPFADPQQRLLQDSLQLEILDL